MTLSVSGIAFFMLVVLAITAVGYLLGRITVKGVNLGTAGVFIIALLFGALFKDQLVDKMKGDELVNQSLNIVETLGLILFVTSVGFIAGPNFFKSLKKNFKSYVLIGAIIIVAGALSAAGCIYIGRLAGAEDTQELTAMIVGLLSGSLTSTPAFAAAKATVASQYESVVSVGHGIAYLFGVIGVVLFVQLMPKFMKADMDAERAKIAIVNTGDKEKKERKLIEIDEFGFAPFAAAALIGLLVGAVKFFGFFSLTTTGGCLLVALLFGHFGRIGRISIMPSVKVLKVFREFGLMLFLIGAGIAGGADFVEYFEPIYFVYGVIMTIIPMIIGFIFAKYVLKLPLLNNLGSITGGMTSTPALGTLITSSGTDDVVASYAATYPMALILIVLASQFLIILF